ncbi:MAG: hypothetical protein AAGB31_07890 [Bdellovibrio sp.]
MKKILIGMMLLPSLVLAQSVGVKDIPATEDTTIEIKKGARSDKDYEIVSEKGEVEGESAPLLKDARVNWKKACNEWKAEIKDLNKENKILSMTCGKMECSTVSMESTCRSQSSHTLKVQVK